MNGYVSSKHFDANATEVLDVAVIWAADRTMEGKTSPKSFLGHAARSVYPKSILAAACSATMFSAHEQARAETPLPCGERYVRLSLGAGYGTGFYQYRSESLPVGGEPARPLEVSARLRGLALGGQLAVVPACVSGVAIGGELGLMREPSVEHGPLGQTQVYALTLAYLGAAVEYGDDPIAPFVFDAGIGVGYAGFSPWDAPAELEWDNVVEPRGLGGAVGHVGAGYQFSAGVALMARLYSGYFANSASSYVPLIALGGVAFRF